jgi:hypothetical protein
MCSRCFGKILPRDRKWVLHGEAFFLDQDFSVVGKVILIGDNVIPP